MLSTLLDLRKRAWSKNVQSLWWRRMGDIVFETLAKFMLIITHCILSPLARGCWRYSFLPSHFFLDLLSTTKNLLDNKILNFLAFSLKKELMKLLRKPKK